jgi:hypothetical protein
MFSNNASHRERCSESLFMWTKGCVSEGCFRQRRASRFAAAAASCQQRKLILKILQNSEFLYFIYIKPYFGLILKFVGHESSAAARGAASGMTCKIWTPAAAVVTVTVAFCCNQR